VKHKGDGKINGTNYCVQTFGEIYFMSDEVFVVESAKNRSSSDVD